jgi:hypothetical protein
LGLQSGKLIITLLRLDIGFIGGSMFDSLADRIREDEHQSVTNTERYLRWAAVGVISVVVFGGLYLGVRLLG